MKLNHKILLTALSVCGVLSCAKNEFVPEGDAAGERSYSFTAAWVNEPQTKTSVQEDGVSIWWSVAEDINLYSTMGAGQKFHSMNMEPSPSVTFSGTLPISTSTKEIWAAYPYNPANIFSGNAVSMTIPARQTASAGTFADRLFPAIAKAEGNMMSFYNVCGGAVFSVQTPGICYVAFRSRGGENLVGTVSVGFDNENLPVVKSLSEGKNMVILTPPDGKFFEVGKKYYAVLVPQQLSSGLDVILQTETQEAIASKTNAIEVHRSLFGQLLDIDEGLVFGDQTVDLLDYEQLAADRASLYDTFARKVASRGSAYLYSPTRILFNMCGDDVVGAGVSKDDYPFQTQLNQFWYDEENEAVKIAFMDYYAAINEFNKLLTLPRYRNDLNKTPVRKLFAEARVLRAYLYFLLSAGWGTPPFVDEYNPDFTINYVFSLDPDKQKPSLQLFAWCAAECEAALPDLDERESTADKQGAYKVTKGFANAVAGKAYLFAGNYADAKTALGRVISSEKYALVPGNKYWENFHIEGDGNEEKIFEPNLEYSSSVSAFTLPTTWMESNMWGWRTDAFALSPQWAYSRIQGWGGLGVPQWFGDEFFDNDGHSYRFDATLKHIDDVVYGMEYENAEINDMTLEQKKESTRIGIINTTGIYGQSFWLPFKQIMRVNDTYSPGQNNRMNNFTIMRYAEVLLLYAEACLRTGDDASATAVVNMIQERAGSQTISKAVDMNVLKREKSYELWLEGSRWFDMLRWGDINRVINVGQSMPNLYDKLFRQPQDGETVVWEHGTEAESRFYTISYAQNEGRTVGFKPKHCYFPIPSYIMQRNPDLSQTPDW